MPKVAERVRVAAAADTVWNRLGGFGAVGEWHPAIKWVEVEGEGPGAVRTAHLKSGMVSVERVTEHAPERRAYRYTMASSPLSVTDYVGEFRVDESGDHASTVSWSGSFTDSSGDEGATIKAIRHFLRTGLDAVGRLYGAATAARLIGINHVALEVGSVDEALAFYRAVFDFELRGRTGTMAFIDMGDQFLALSEGRTQAPDTGRHFGLVVDDRSGVRERAVAAGGRVVEGRGLEVLDPWGNRLEIVEYQGVQFTKADAVLHALNVAPDKAERAMAELKDKGIVSGPKPSPERG